MEVSYNNLAESDKRNAKKIIAVTTEEELIEQLNNELKANPKAIFRPFGGKHSWSPSVLSNDEPDVILIDTSQLGSKRNDFVPIQLEQNYFLIPAPPSFTQEDLVNYASTRTPALSVHPTGAVKTSIHIGGFLNSGCHGSGYNLPPVSENVLAVRIIIIRDHIAIPVLFTDPNIRSRLSFETIEVIDDYKSEFKANLMDYVRVNFGTLGIVTEFWIKCELQFNVNATDEVLLMSDVINDKFAENYLYPKDHLELFYAPFNQLKKHYTWKHFPYIYVPDLARTQIQLKYANKIDEKSNSASNTTGQDLFHDRLVNFLNNTDTKEEDLLIKIGGKFLDAVTNHINVRTTPLLLQAFGKSSYGHELSSGGFLKDIVACGKVLALKNPKYTRIQTYNDFSLYEHTVVSNLVDIEMQIPLDADAKNFCQIWKQTIELIQSYAVKGEYPCNIVLHSRFNASSKSVLSSLHSNDQTHYASIECICAYEPNASKSYLNSLGLFIYDLLNLWKTNSARPHFAKLWFDLPDNCNGRSLNNFRSNVIESFKDNIIAFKNFRQSIDSGNHFYGGLVKKFDEIINI